MLCVSITSLELSLPSVARDLIWGSFTCKMTSQMEQFCFFSNIGCDMITYLTARNLSNSFFLCLVQWLFQWDVAIHRAVGRSTFLVQTETLPQLQDSSPWNFADDGSFGDPPDILSYPIMKLTFRVSKWNVSPTSGSMAMTFDQRHSCLLQAEFVTLIITQLSTRITRSAFPVFQCFVLWSNNIVIRLSSISCLDVLSKF